MNRETIITSEEMEQKYKELASGAEQAMSTDFRDKCKGAIMGLAIGDALGAPIEFKTKFGHQWIEQMEDIEVWGIPKGYYTDDTSMAICIMQGYMNRGRGSVIKSIANEFVDWWAEGKWSSTGKCFDIGTSCRRGLMEYMQKGTLVNGGQYSTGCGGVMRFAPSWMIEYKESENGNEYRRLGAMLDINNIDHHNTNCIRTIAKIAGIFDSHIKDNKPTNEPTMFRGWRDADCGFDAVRCLEGAIWAFKNTRNFRDALVACVNLGGDTDSCGAVCGQIAGSYYGYSGIPKEWLADLYQREEIEGMVDKFLDMTIE